MKIRDIIMEAEATNAQKIAQLRNLGKAQLADTIQKYLDLGLDWDSASEAARDDIDRGKPSQTQQRTEPQHQQPKAAPKKPEKPAPVKPEYVPTDYGDLAPDADFMGKAADKFMDKTGLGHLKKAFKHGMKQSSTDFNRKSRR